MTAATQLPSELWGKILLEFSDFSHAARLSQTCTTLKQIGHDEAVWSVFYRRRFRVARGPLVSSEEWSAAEMDQRFSLSIDGGGGGPVSSATPTECFLGGLGVWPGAVHPVGRGDIMYGSALAAERYGLAGSWRDNYMHLHELEGRFRRG